MNNKNIQFFIDSYCEGAITSALSRILLLKLLSKFSILFIVFLNYIIDQYIFLGIFFIEGVLIYEEIFFELKNFLS